MPVAVTQLTVAAAVKATDDVVAFVASGAAYLKSKYLAYIDREAIELVSMVEPALPAIWRVKRGVHGTPVTAHAINNQVYVGPPDVFAMVSPSGGQTFDTVAALPHINILTGDAFTLSTGGSWYQI